MASLSEIYVKKETLETILKVLNSKTGEDAKGVKITISLNDEQNQFGQNVSSFISQTKDQREAKTPKFYVGNGKTFWSKGETPTAKKVEQQAPPTPPPSGQIADNVNNDPLPF